jgi:hypothetical protein
MFNGPFLQRLTLRNWVIGRVLTLRHCVIGRVLTLRHSVTTAGYLETKLQNRRGEPSAVRQ